MHEIGAINRVFLSTLRVWKILWIAIDITLYNLSQRDLKRVYSLEPLRDCSEGCSRRLMLLLLFEWEDCSSCACKVRGDQLRRTRHVDSCQWILCKNNYSPEVEVQTEVHELMSISCNRSWTIDFWFVVLLPVRVSTVKFVSAFLWCVIGRWLVLYCPIGLFPLHWLVKSELVIHSSGS